jgi:HAD superfamily 5'-nucleotidase-like hydrolase
LNAAPPFTQLGADLLDLIGAKDTFLLDPPRAVYANRDLNLADIELVGFDMDYTLAIYRKATMEQLQYDMTVERLVREAQYPADIRQLAYDPNFIVRGLVVDKKNGHLLKMDAHNKVWRAIHGRRQLLWDEVERKYKNRKIKLSADRYASLDTLFAMPEACLYANLVDFFEARHSRGERVEPLVLDPSKARRRASPIDTWKLFDDVRFAIDEIHRDGSLKSIITSKMERYIEADPKLPLALHKLRSAGKRLFLMTNSYWAYTNAVMTYLLEGRLREYGTWQAYFDTIIVGSKKPTFFTERNPFLELDTSKGGDGEVVREGGQEKFDRSVVYQAGNIRDFEKMAGCAGEQILYVGDHIYGDILRSKKDSMWRTALVVEELEPEIQGVMRWATDLDKLSAMDADRYKNDTAIRRHRALLAHVDAALAEAEDRGLSEEAVSQLTESAKQIRREIDRAKRYVRDLDRRIVGHQDELERRFNPYWGRLLKEHNELSRFGSQVEDYACVYTGRVSNFLQYSPMHDFRSAREMMSHDRTLQDTIHMRRARLSAAEDEAALLEASVDGVEDGDLDADDDPDN